MGPGGIAGSAPTAVEGALRTGAQAQLPHGRCGPPGLADLASGLDAREWHVLLPLLQPAAQGVPGVGQVRSGPAEHQQVLGAGAGHVGQALRLGDLGLLVLLGREPAHAPVGLQVQVQLRLTACRPAAAEALRRFGGLPEVGADHQGVLEPFAAVHGHHGDGGFGGIAAAEMGLGAVAVLLQAQAPEPVRGRLGPEALAVHLLLHQLRGLLQIGQGPAPQGEPRQARRPLQMRQGRRQAEFGEPFRQGTQLRGQLIPLTRAAGLDLGGGPAQQGRGRQQLQASQLTGLGEGIEEALQGAGPEAFKDITSAHQPAGDLPAFQGGPQGFGLVVAADQQADVTRVDRPAVQLQPLAQELLAEARHLGLEAFAWIELQQLQRRRVAGELQLSLVGLRQHLGHLESALDQPGPHQGVQARHQVAAGAAVLEEAKAAIGFFGRLAVGLQLPAAEAVDRLLGIAHHHEQMAAGFRGKGPFQDAPLDRIGVLELVDQRRPVAVRHRLQQGGGRRRLRTRVELLEQLAKADLTAALAPPLQLRSAPMAEVQQRAFRGALHHSGDGLQQRGLGQGDLIAMGGGRGLREGAGVEVLLEVLLLQHRVVAGRFLQLAEPGLNAVQAIRLGLEAIGLVLDPQALEFHGGRRELLLQRLAAAWPFGAERRPAHAPERRQLLRQAHAAAPSLRQGGELQGRVAIEAAQQVHQLLRVDLLALQSRHQMGR